MTRPSIRIREGLTRDVPEHPDLRVDCHSGIWHYQGARWRRVPVKGKRSTRGPYVLVKHDDGTVEHVFVAELILKAWAGEKPEGKVPCFIDGNHCNVELSNMFWGDAAREGVKAICSVCGREFRKLRNGVTCSAECRRKRRLESNRQCCAANPEKERERRRKRYAANPEKEREYSREYYTANPEKAREYSREYRAANRDEVNERKRERRRSDRWANPEQVRELDRKRWAANSEKINERRRNRYAAKRQAAP